MTAVTAQQIPDVTEMLGATVEIVERLYGDEALPDNTVVAPTQIRVNGLPLLSTYLDPVIVERIDPIPLTGRPTQCALVTLSVLAYRTLVPKDASLPDPVKLWATAPIGKDAVFELLQTDGAQSGHYGDIYPGQTIVPDRGVRLVAAGVDPVWLLAPDTRPAIVGLRPHVKPYDGTPPPMRVSLTLMVRRLLIGDTSDAA